MPRDNFSKSVITKLRTGVAHRCSNPDCRVPTAAAGTDLGSITGCGIAAHIHAAAPGGPRYRSDMNKQTRTSIENGIWLCANCSIKIDRDEKKYSADLLRKWKKQAEETARFELGKQLPKASDAQDQISMALTGLPVAFIPQAISNVHVASEKCLEKLDPRFRVEAVHKNGAVIFELHPRETVPLELVLQPEAVNTWSEAISDIMDHGSSVSFHAREVSLTGSALLDMFSEQHMFNKLAFIPVEKTAIVSLSLHDKLDNKVASLGEIHGFFTHGRKSLTFKGSTFDNILTFEINFYFSSQGDVTLQVNFEKWVGRNVNALQYFEKIATLYDCLSQGGFLNVCLEFEGTTLLEGKIRSPDNDEIFSVLHAVLVYTRRVRELAELLRKDIYFQSPNFSKEDHEDLINILRLLDLTTYSSKLTTVIIANESGENIRMLQSLPPSEFKFVQSESSSFSVFGQEIKIPKIEISFSNFSTKVLGDTSDIKEGDLVTIEWIPTENSSISRDFEF